MNSEALTETESNSNSIHKTIKKAWQLKLDGGAAKTARAAEKLDTRIFTINVDHGIKSLVLKIVPKPDHLALHIQIGIATAKSM